MDRREFLIAAAAASTAKAEQTTTTPTSSTSAAHALPDAVEELSLADIGAAFADGRMTSQQLTQSYLTRIDRLDRRGPSLGSVIETNPRALEIAAALDAERKSRGARGPLHGVPVLIKDNVETADHMMSTAGSLALTGWYAPKDAPLVERLRAAGAVILGKTNLSEWANFRSTHSLSGWSGRGGQTRNPYSTDRSPSGSSSGSAVAVSANLCALAVGTETNGSIVSPASVNGIVGIKPTVGLVSRSGIIPISASQDTAGPMARTVREAAILLSVLSGLDPEDPATTDARHEQLDYTRTLDAKGLRGARLGIARKSFGFNADVDKLMEEGIAHLRSEGAGRID